MKPELRIISLIRTAAIEGSSGAELCAYIDHLVESSPDLEADFPACSTMDENGIPLVIMESGKCFKLKGPLWYRIEQPIPGTQADRQSES